MILIISNRLDFTADCVVREIRKRGLGFARLNTDEFPSQAYGIARFGDAKHPSRTLRWLNRDRTLDWNQVSAVLYRRPVPLVPPDGISEPALRQFCRDESYDFLRGLWFSLRCHWMSHPEAVRMAEHKVYQLGIAESIGLPVPRTLVSNDPGAILEFFHSCRKGMIVKPLYLGFIDDPANPQAIFTSVVSENDMAEIATAAAAPSIYQEQVDKVLDVRVTVVGERLFVAGIEAPTLPPNIPDWRYLPASELRHFEYQLPSGLAQACLELVRRLGLDFGAIDLAVDTAGSIHFLEINPNGQWVWLEDLLGFPICSAIVDRLASGSTGTGASTGWMPGSMA